MAEKLGAKDALDVYVNQNTLEHELFSAGNESLLKSAFLAIHSGAGEDWKSLIEDVAAEDRPDAFLKLLASKRTRKGDLAQEIAARIEEGDTFQVPQYLDKAIKKISEP